jgi:hypothetical protein
LNTKHKTRKKTIKRRQSNHMSGEEKKEGLLDFPGFGTLVLFLSAKLLELERSSRVANNQHV